MPTKGELIQLQKLYKTDEKIGERLGGVPAYLVAYWRRKKGVPRHSQPKFSENEIRNLWERFGDDDRCGLELGISKAAFYNWRRRYGIREKPAFLKLEQLELNFPGLKTLSRAASLYGKQTVAQKILARAAGRQRLAVGELAVVEPDVVVSHDDTGLIVETFNEIGADHVWNSNKIVVVLSRRFHPGGDGAARGLPSYRAIREFIRRQGIRSFFGDHQGTCHQVVLEQAEIVPGQMSLSTDHCTTAFGALGALAAQIDPREMAAVWASGRTWLRVPKTIRIDVTGRRQRRVCATDVALSIIHRLGVKGANYRALEYYGSSVTQMSISERITLAAFGAQMGAKTVILPYESNTRRFLVGRTTIEYSAVLADKNAEYEEMFQFSIERFSPQMAGPGGFDLVRPVADLEGKTVTLVIIGTGCSGRFDDLRVATEIVKGKRTHPECRLFIVPASRQVYLEALKKGLVRVLVEAGAVIMNPGFCVFPDDWPALLPSDEHCLVTGGAPQPRRGGPERGEVYVCSPATAAASALNAAITDPVRFGR